MKIINQQALEFILTDEVIDLISKAITHSAFRNGPIENMHSNGQLSEEDMKTLNKYMVNNLATILTAVKQGQWSGLNKLLGALCAYGKDWDRAELSDHRLNRVLNLSGVPHADNVVLMEGVDYHTRNIVRQPF